MRVALAAAAKAVILADDDGLRAHRGDEFKRYSRAGRLASSGVKRRTSAPVGPKSANLRSFSLGRSAGAACARGRAPRAGAGRTCRRPALASSSSASAFARRISSAWPMCTPSKVPAPEPTRGPGIRVRCGGSAWLPHSIICKITCAAEASRGTGQIRPAAAAPMPANSPVDIYAHGGDEGAGPRATREEADFRSAPRPGGPCRRRPPGGAISPRPAHQLSRDIRAERVDLVERQRVVQRKRARARPPERRHMPAHAERAADVVAERADVDTPPAVDFERKRSRRVGRASGCRPRGTRAARSRRSRRGAASLLRAARPCA